MGNAEFYVRKFMPFMTTKNDSLEQYGIMGPMVGEMRARGVGELHWQIVQAHGCTR